MKRSILALTLTFLFCANSHAEEKEFMPSAIYNLDPMFSHHIIVVEKSTHSLFLYKYNDQIPKLVKKYQIATGKIKGNKSIQGDKKTPEGIYQFQKFYSSNNLIQKYGDYGKIYGAGAFTLSYPNEIDRRKGKTGGGIWLHSTDDDKRVSKGLDSRGCVVAIDADLKDISKYIDLNNTQAVILQDLNFLTKENWTKNRNELLGFISKWQTAWQSKDFNAYINSYSQSEFNSRKGKFTAYKNYKRRVFARADKPEITFRHTSILNNGEYTVVTMEQDYRSPVVNDIGKKILYLKKDRNYEWKIVAENWKKLPTNQEVAFTPSMRFFTEDSADKKEIANDTGSI